MEEKFLEETLRKSVEKLVSDSIQIEIDEKVDKFRKELVSRKDKYIAEVMKGIRIIHEHNCETMHITYKIIFENIVKLDD